MYVFSTKVKMKIFFYFVMISLLFFNHLLADTKLYQKRYSEAMEAYNNKAYTKAFDLYKESAKLGYDKAQYQLAGMYERGIGVTINIDNAIAYYKRAVKQRNKSAAKALQKLYVKSKRFEEAYAWYMEQLYMADASFGYMLGLKFENGEEVNKDLHKAAMAYRKSAGRWHNRAQVKIAQFYEKGMGVEKDEKKAYHYYNNAAKDGLAEARYAIGRMYYDGRGTRVNKQNAYKWMKMAAKQGHDGAKEFLKKHTF